MALHQARVKVVGECKQITNCDMLFFLHPGKIVILPEYLSGLCLCASWICLMQNCCAATRNRLELYSIRSFHGYLWDIIVAFEVMRSGTHDTFSLSARPTKTYISAIICNSSCQVCSIFLSLHKFHRAIATAAFGLKPYSSKSLTYEDKCDNDKGLQCERHVQQQEVEFHRISNYNYLEIF